MLRSKEEVAEQLVGKRLNATITHLKAIRVLDLVLTMRRLNEGDSMVLVVVSHERESIILVHDLTAKKGAVKLEHLLEVVRTKNNMSELGW